jgi:hypothetical protein
MMYKILNYFICNEQNNFVCPQVVSADTKCGLQSFCLDDDTKMTDIVWQNHINTMGLLVSRRYLDSLSGYAVQAHEIRPAEVVYLGTPHTYYWIHIAEELENVIDFAASSFIGSGPDGLDEVVKIHNRQEMHQKAWQLLNSTNGRRLVPGKIAFLPGTPRYDLICLRVTGERYFVSAGLADELVQRKLTGFDVVDTKVEFVFP